jgi:hypothetical protein
MSEPYAVYVPIYHILYTFTNVTGNKIEEDLREGGQGRGYECFRMAMDIARRTRRLRTQSEVTKITPQLLQQRVNTVLSTTRSRNFI